MRRLPILLAVALVLAGAFAGWRWATRWAPDRAAYPVQGVTVTHASGAIDWPAVHAGGADFAFVQSSVGDHRDPGFETNHAAASAAGLRTGALHRFSLCQPVADQLRAYLTTVPRTADALPAALALDFDAGCTARPGRAVTIAAIRGFLDGAEHHDGRAMLLRISPAFEEAYGVSGAIDRPLWAERLALEPEYLARPWRIWSATTIRRVDGIAGATEWNVLNR